MRTLASLLILATLAALATGHVGAATKLGMAATAATVLLSIIAACDPNQSRTSQ